MTEDTLLIIVALAGLTVIGLVAAFFLVVWTLNGATVLFVFAADQGFLGIFAFFVAWVILFPVMLIGSIFFGFVSWLHTRAATREAKHEMKRKPHEPPLSSWERSKWANRLPPYDKDD
jgi:hypothetical protein